MPDSHSRPKVAIRYLSSSFHILAVNIGITAILLALANSAAFFLNKIRLNAPPHEIIAHETEARKSGLVPYRLRIARKEFHGTQLNIDHDGWRTGKASGLQFDDWSDDNRNVFLIGGSAAFGYSVDDDQTIAAHLERRGREKRITGLRVYNLGQMAYQIHDEVTLLVDVLRRGHVPDAVIFYDGANEAGRGLPGRLTENVLSAYVEGDYAYWTVGYLDDEPILKWDKLSLVKLAARIRPYLVSARAGGG